MQVDLLDFFSSYDSENLEKKKLLTELEELYKSFPGEYQWNATKIWREYKIGKTPVTFSNLIRYFNPEKEHHIRTIEYLQNCFKEEVWLENKPVEKTLKEQDFSPIKTSHGFTENSLASKIHDHIVKNNYPLYNLEGELTIVYVEGLSYDLKTNQNASNKFNDLRMVLSFYPSPKILGRWEATTSPGDFYTDNPMNPQGAFKLLEGWHNKCWIMGFHKKDNHPALVQRGDKVCGYRDKDANHEYSKDKIECGYFGINQHHGWDMPFFNVGKTSAGCLVGRTISGHLEFMRLLKLDIRYQRNKNFKFSTLVIPSKLLIN